MDEDTWALIVLIVLVGVIPYSAYRLGRNLERKALTGALVESMSSMEDVYLRGYADCQQQKDQIR